MRFSILVCNRIGGWSQKAHGKPSRLVRSNGFASAGIARAADLADGAVAAAGRTVLAAVVDDLQLQAGAGRGS